MNLITRQGTGRRMSDKVDFTNCPKYKRYDLTEEQIDEIIERVHKKAAQNVGEYVLDTGKSVFIRFIFVLGLVSIFASWWLAKHGINI